MNIKVVRQVLEWNQDCSDEIKRLLNEKGVYMINVLGSPGAGKTSAIIELIKRLRSKYNIAVVEGDIAGQVDAEKIDSLGISVVQLNTDGACHIEAMSIKSILEYFSLDGIDIIFVENVGNLICTAEFDIGEDLRIALLSIPEGDDKVGKYPIMFSRANAIALNKYDMMQHFDFDDIKVQEDIKLLNPSAKLFRVSSKTGFGMDSIARYIESKASEKAK